MKFPEEYIKHGEFTLHSGQRSTFKYEVSEVMRNPFYYNFIARNIPFSRHYIGIETGGREMAESAHEINPESKLSWITKKGALDGDGFPDGEYSLIDDVISTGGSILGAIAIIGREPKEIIVAVDRRGRNDMPKVRTIFEHEPAWFLAE